MSSTHLQTFMRVVLPFSLLVLLPSVAFAGDLGVCASSVGGEGILSGFAQQFQTATTGWGTTALEYARNLFFALVAIEMAWSGITYVLQKDSLPDFFASIALKLLSVGFFFVLLQPQYGPAWINAIIASFMQAGSAIGGQTQFGPSDPSAIFNCGTDIAGAMIGSLSERGFSLDLLGVLEAYLTALLCALGVMFAFAVVAGQLLVTLIESYIVVGGGLFFLGFTGSRWTLVFGEKYLGYIFSVGTKLFMLELIVGLGYGLGRQWAALFASDSVPPGTYIEVVGAALVFGFVAWQIPGLAASLMNGAPRMTLGGFLNNLGAVGVGGAVLGSTIVGLAAGASTLVGKGIEALKNAAAVGATDAGVGTTATDAEHVYDDVGDDLRNAQGASSHAAFDEGEGAVSPERADSVEAVDTEERSTADVPGLHHDSAEKKSDAPRSETTSESDMPEAASSADETTDNVPFGSATASDNVQAGQTDATSSQDDVQDEPTRSSPGATSDVAEETVAEGSTSGDAPASESSDGAETKAGPGKDSARQPFRGMQGFRPPPVPDDTADGSIHIRFKHPE